jgi:hypothetical protein
MESNYTVAVVGNVIIQKRHYTRFGAVSSSLLASPYLIISRDLFSFFLCKMRDLFTKEEVENNYSLRNEN